MCNQISIDLTSLSSMDITSYHDEATNFENVALRIHCQENHIEVVDFSMGDTVQNLQQELCDKLNMVRCSIYLEDKTKSYDYMIPTLSLNDFPVLIEKQKKKEEIILFVVENV